MIVETVRFLFLGELRADAPSSARKIKIRRRRVRRSSPGTETGSTKQPSDDSVEVYKSKLVMRLSWVTSAGLLFALVASVALASAGREVPSFLTDILKVGFSYFFGAISAYLGVAAPSK